MTTLLKNKNHQHQLSLNNLELQSKPGQQQQYQQQNQNRDFFTSQYQQKFKQLQNNLLQSKINFHKEQKQQEFDSKKAYRNMMEAINKFKPKYHQMEKTFKAVDFRKLREERRQHEMEQERIQTALEESNQRRKLSLKRKKQAQRPYSMNQEYIEQQNSQNLLTHLKKQKQQDERRHLSQMFSEKNFQRFQDNTLQKEQIYRNQIKAQIMQDQEDLQESQGILRFSPAQTSPNFWKKSARFSKPNTTCSQSQDFHLASLQSINSQQNNQENQLQQSQNSQNFSNFFSHKNKFVPVAVSTQSTQFFSPKGEVQNNNNKNFVIKSQNYFSQQKQQNNSEVNNNQIETPTFQKQQHYKSQQQQNNGQLEKIMKNSQLHSSKSEYFQSPKTSTYGESDSINTKKPMQTQESEYVYTESEFKRKFLLSQRQYMRNYKYKQMEKQKKLEQDQYDLENERILTNQKNSSYRNSFQRSSQMSNTCQTPRI